MSSPSVAEESAVLTVRTLTPDEGPLFRAMTFPAFRHLLELRPTVVYPHEGDENPVRPVAVGAQAGPAPVGLALGTVPLGPAGQPELLSLFVEPAARRRGIAADLLARIEAAVGELGFASLRAVYMTGKPGAAIFERMIASRGWSEPATRMYTLQFTIEQATSSPWYRTYRMRSNFEVFPWTELTAEDERRLRSSQEASPWIADDLVPWKYDRRGFEPVSSLGARLDGEVVGWVINHQIRPHTVRFTCSFIREDLSRRGRIVPLYSESIRRLATTSCKTCMFNVPIFHPAMVAFVQRRCAPYATALRETRGSEKRLAPTTPETPGDPAP